MTQAAPASFSISALTSPVNAPDTSLAQVWPPIAIPPAAACTARVISVEAGADWNIGGWGRFPDPGGNGSNFAQLRPRSVHLPVTGDQVSHALLTFAQGDRKVHPCNSA
jgi:hypothetical protein